MKVVVAIDSLKGSLSSMEAGTSIKEGILNDNRTAVIEMVAAAGIELIPMEDLNPLNTTTFGVSEMIKDEISSTAQVFRLIKAVKHFNVYDIFLTNIWNNIQI